MPGLSRSRRNPNGVAVVDVDIAEEVERAERTFGRTPAMIDTRRARHLIYRAPEDPIPFNTLRDVGIEIDIKHGQSGAGISVAPPSIHPEQTDFQYRWSKDSGPEALADAPLFRLKALLDLRASRSKMLHNETQTAPPPGREGLLPSGGRGARSARHSRTCSATASRKLGQRPPRGPCLGG